MRKILRIILNLLHLELNCLYDYWRFKKHYSPESDDSKNKKNFQAWILQDKHRIEKGLSLPEPRYFFGEAVLKRLSANLVEYSANFEKDSVYYFGIGSLNAYEDFHLNGKKALPEFFVALKEKIDNSDFNHPTCKLVGLGEFQPTKDYGPFFDEFSASRHSCRNFITEKPITAETFKAMMSLTIRAPSVCNRQHWHAHFFTGEQKSKILALQNGNAGFTENIPYIAVISSDLASFYTPDERNQAYTDGGLFAMNLMYAMHSLNVSSCPLNWCNSFVMENRFHKLNYINNSESVIMVLAFGYRNPKGSYAKSPRMEVNNFYTLNGID